MQAFGAERRIRVDEVVFAFAHPAFVFAPGHGRAGVVEVVAAFGHERVDVALAVLRARFPRDDRVAQLDLAAEAAGEVVAVLTRFGRVVVDRVADQSSDTVLLAVYAAPLLAGHVVGDRRVDDGVLEFHGLVDAAAGPAAFCPALL